MQVTRSMPAIARDTKSCPKMGDVQELGKHIPSTTLSAQPLAEVALLGPMVPLNATTN